MIRHIANCWHNIIMSSNLFLVPVKKKKERELRREIVNKCLK